MDAPEKMFQHDIDLPDGNNAIIVGHNPLDSREDDIHGLQDKKKFNLQVKLDETLEKAKNALNEGFRDKLGVPIIIGDKGQGVGGIETGKKVDQEVAAVGGEEAHIHKDVKKEINVDKQKFLEKQKEEQEKRKQEKKKSDSKLASLPGVNLPDGEPDDGQSKERRNTVREVSIFMEYCSNLSH